ncbi:MAG: hypothetical protein ABIH23_35685 [bacterium]
MNRKNISSIKPFQTVLIPVSVLCYLVLAASAQTPIDIGTRLELFVDDCLVQSMTGLDRIMHAPVPREIVLDHGEPWEGSGTGYHTVFQDGDLYRMYYKAWHLSVQDDGLKFPHDTLAAYAESHDGIHWKKPNLGLFEFNGSKENNLIWTGPGSHDFTPFLDLNPNCQPEAKYKAVASGPGGLIAFHSPDGLRWSRLGKEPIVTKGAFDTQNLAFWDTQRGEYRTYIRDFHKDADGKNALRDIRTATSTDFIHWSDPVWLEYPDVSPLQLYTNQIAPYYRAPHIFIGFPTRYIERGWSDSMRILPHPSHRRLRAAASERYGTALTDSLLMSSRDGREFHRWEEAFLRPGLRPVDNWAYGDNYIAWHVVETKSSIEGAPNELSLYATESYWTGLSSRLRRYTLRIDGFVSVHAGRCKGQFVTKPIRYDGRQLVLNFSTSAAGWIRVDILDAAGRVLAKSAEIFGDELERVITWEGGKDVGRLAQSPVQLRFTMRDADLYSFSFH